MTRKKDQENAGSVEPNGGEPAPAADPKPEGETTPAPQPEKLTPAGWAERKGIAPKANPLLPFLEPIAKSTKDCPLGIHLHAADVLHGWSHHTYNFQDPKKALLITEQDFDAALQAAAEYPACNAHLAAVAPSAPFRAELVKRDGAEKAAKDAAEKAAADSKDKQ